MKLQFKIHEYQINRPTIEELLKLIEALVGNQVDEQGKIYHERKPVKHSALARGWATLKSFEKKPTSEPKTSYHGCFTGDCPHENQAECLKALESHCAELETVNAALRKDKERLDWFSGPVENRDAAINHIRNFQANAGTGYHELGLDIRQAIDYAMRSTPQTKEGQA